MQAAVKLLLKAHTTVSGIFKSTRKLKDHQVPTCYQHQVAEFFNIAMMDMGSVFSGIHLSKFPD